MRGRHTHKNLHPKLQMELDILYFHLLNLATPPLGVGEWLWGQLCHWHSPSWPSLATKKVWTQPLWAGGEGFEEEAASLAAHRCEHGCRAAHGAGSLGEPLGSGRLLSPFYSPGNWGTEWGDDLARLRLSSGSGREVRMTLLITGSPARHPHTCLVLSHSVVPDSVQPRGLQPARPLCPWDPPNKNTGVGCHFLFQEIFPTQGSNTGLPHCRQTLYHLSHQGSSFKEVMKVKWSHMGAP